MVAGEQWHRSDFTLGMLHGGYRPLLMGEVEQDGDEFFGPTSREWIDSPDARKVVDDRHHVRTTRPLPAIETPAAPKMQQSSYSDGGAAMPLRDWFAGQALAGLIAASGNDRGEIRYKTEAVAESAYEAADAMLKAREVLP